MLRNWQVININFICICSFLGICAVLGIQIYFPFNIADGEEIPYHRMQSIRVAVFVTTFYALYLINSIREVIIHF